MLARHRRWLVAAALAALLVVASRARGDEPEPLLAVVQAAVAAGKTQRTAVTGFHDAQRTFTELPAANVLIGFECGVGRFVDIETVYALRAIYLTPDGVQVGPEHGPFADRNLGPKKTVKTRVLRMVRLQAPAGYAVGCITIRTGLNINGLSLTYLKLDGQQLDPREPVVSDWVGDRIGGSAARIGGAGAIIVGIFGSQDDTHVLSLGLITLPPPALGQLPANPPPIGKVAARDAEVAEEPAEAVAVPAPAPKAHKPASRTVGWLPYAIFAAVTAGVLVASLAFLGAKKRPAKPRSRQGEPRLEPPVAQPAVDRAAVGAKSPTSSGIRAGLPRPPLPVRTPGPQPLESRGPMLCGRCSCTVPADPPTPPWCPHCGGDLTPATEPRASDAAVAPRSPTLLQPAYFLGRMGRGYRIYILPSQLLFIDYPALDEGRGTKARAWHWTLDMADIHDLIDMAERERDSFSVDLEDLCEMRIEALSFWQRAFAQRCAARLRFLHPVRGPLAVDLLKPDDVRVAVKQLTGLLGELLDVDAKWDWRKQRYVPKG